VVLFVWWILVGSGENCQSYQAAEFAMTNPSH
jgi:hypothetical protein